ncbi:Glycosyltransferase, group 2 family protein [Candidatus Sulfobium mesophilum]|uniref:Glycosyltransferase, group 2 family protein n=1 Tax=Candidatus Sulfobium mesophilum TaxID=2016548 RepID=A0A2U3QE71_9BACT|nr:Glycosyltransferase, group 2 family protein [Candidatus Sulfobium mesophilum]
MKTLIIVPAYNEESSIGDVIKDIVAHSGDADILVINDGSTDATSAVAKARGIKVIDLPYNLGIGGAMQTGYLYAERNGYDIAVQFDADGQHRADQLAALVSPVAGGDADLAIGSRFLGEKAYHSRLARLLGIKILSMVISFLIGRKITDPTSGFRAVNRRVIEYYSGRYPEDYPEPEAIVLVQRAGFRTIEVPALMKEREAGRSSITGARAFYYMIKVLLAIMIDMIKTRGGKSWTS